ncbi:MAG: RdgB/HAM1 family non-canonical purine NTP pyrophosphatase [Clostridiales bacterium]|nr:RdgB/HAM1 family non-canonical purine NTP pyrophosphatase [Clostridiales bacterium]
MKFIIATNNNKKLAELKGILNKLGIEAVSLAEAGIKAEVEETEDTFEGNARLKAKAAMETSGLPAIADDSGLVTDALDGAPGVMSARFGGNACKDDFERCMYLLDKLSNVPDNRRGARFVSVIACVFPDGREFTARGECRGIITKTPRGDGGFGYDPVFEVEGTGKTMAEIPAEQKNRISHRAYALKAFYDKLGKFLDEA